MRVRDSDRPPGLRAVTSGPEQEKAAPGAPLQAPASNARAPAPSRPSFTPSPSPPTPIESPRLPDVSEETLRAFLARLEEGKVTVRLPLREGAKIDRFVVSPHTTAVVTLSVQGGLIDFTRTSVQFEDPRSGRRTDLDGPLHVFDLSRLAIDADGAPVADIDWLAPEVDRAESERAFGGERVPRDPVLFYRRVREVLAARGGAGGGVAPLDLAEPARVEFSFTFAPQTSVTERLQGTVDTARIERQLSRLADLYLELRVPLRAGARIRPEWPRWLARRDWLGVAVRENTTAVVRVPVRDGQIRLDRLRVQVRDDDDRASSLDAPGPVNPYRLHVDEEGQLRAHLPLLPDLNLTEALLGEGQRVSASPGELLRTIITRVQGTAAIEAERAIVDPQRSLVVHGSFTVSLDT